MITVALIVGDPGREDLQLNDGSLAAAAKMTGVHGAVTPPPVGRGQAARSRTRNRKSAARSRRSMSKLQICWVIHGPSGWAVTPRMCP
jgi:hypothetical protein